MPRRLTLSGDALTQMMAVAHQLGGGRDLDDILQIIARTVTEVIGFDAVAVNVRRDDGTLEVRAVVGPPEVEELRGGLMPESEWRELLESCERWGGLYFSRTPDFPVDVPAADPWRERFSTPSGEPGPPTQGFLPPEPWQAEFALLAPVWTEGRTDVELQSVISVDLPRSGHTPDAEQQMLLELFASQVGVAIDRVSEAENASDRISLYRAAFVESPLATALVDANLHLTDVNDALLHLADAVPGELERRHLADLLDVDASELAAHFAQLEPGQTVTAAHEWRLRHPRGQDSDRWVDVTARRVDSVHDDPRYVCTLTDRTVARSEMEAIRHRADHDALTGLSTRPVWLDDVTTRLTRPTEIVPGTEEPRVIGVLFCDLDGFKRVNDVAGHMAGDGVLIAVADILRAAAGPGDVVCRWGGDEFAVVATRSTVPAIEEVAATIISSLTEMTAAAQPADPAAGVSISIGIAAVPPGRAAATDDLVDIADNALYRAKRDPARSTHITVI